jgi:L-threonylcarbamoyladenylate synthase
LLTQIESAVIVLRQGGVIAYPTEYCFGLGCDPQDSIAVSRILKIKRRQAAQGVILIAGSYTHIDQYAKLQTAPMVNAIKASWPGPTTWLLPIRRPLPKYLVGSHSTIAMRLSAHSVCRDLCINFGGAIVSTSANRHGELALMSAAAVEREFADEVDMIIDAPLGGAQQPSHIRDGLSGIQLR